MKGFCVYFLTLILSSAAVPKEFCETCAHKDSCPLFKSLSQRDQVTLIEKFSCEPPYEHYSAEDYICCSNKIWGVQTSDHLAKLIHREYSLRTDTHKLDQNNASEHVSNLVENGQFNYSKPNLDGSKYSEYGLNRKPRQSNRNVYWNERPGSQWNNQNNNRGRNNMQDYNRGPEWNYWRRNTGNNGRGYPRPEFNIFHPNVNKSDTRSQCDRITSLTPDPQSGCCGQEASDDDRITDPRTSFNPAPSIHAHDRFSPGFKSIPYLNTRGKRDDVNVTVDNRIAGGSATELDQYPWTVLLLTVFNYGNREASFNCGGSLINSQYVLSAAHCVYDKNGSWKSTQVTLAEYDKRSFPRDCKASKCVENKVMYARNVVVHPRFNEDMLLNDISLIRLNGIAPYNDYIRPICLPTINVDMPRFDNLQFEVAGWGQNGQIPSDVKRSTIMHLVGRNECRRSYPMLTDKHLCAAGNKGEDTCKGDSGGPLMMLQRGRYYVMGVVSGKRADTPCGNVIVPSLYTNVYYYLDWIRSNIRS